MKKPQTKKARRHRQNNWHRNHDHGHGWRCIGDAVGRMWCSCPTGELHEKVTFLREDERS